MGYCFTGDPNAQLDFDHYFTNLVALVDDTARKMCGNKGSLV